MSHGDWQIVLVSGGWSLVVGVAGLLLATLLRRRSLRWQFALVVVVALGGFVVGLVAAAHAMFLSNHDFRVVLLVLPAAGVVSFLLAVVVAERAVWLSRSVEESARRLATDDGSAAGREVVGPAELMRIRDELQRTSRRLAESRALAERSEASRRELVAWVSHDLRTPLAGLRAMSEALEDGMVDDPGRYHRQIRAEVDRLTRMVDDLFELSRIQAGALQMTIESVRLRDIVSDALASADPVARRRGVRLGGDVGDDLVVTGDARELGRVVSNLVMNAIRHTPADGVVHVEASGGVGSVRLSVRDECGGIPGEDLPRVFDDAWRGTHARTPESSVDAGPESAGAGLGLAIVRGIVEAHRGSVGVVNEGPGCRFLVTLPT